MYILRLKFDICCFMKDLPKMTSTLNDLYDAVKHLTYQGIYQRRKAILNLIEGQSKGSVRLYLQNKGFSEETINKIIKKYSQ